MNRYFIENSQKALTNKRSICYTIVVYAPRYLDGKRVQLLDIYYSGVGILHELTPEELEEAFQQHLTERNKEKTA